MKYFLFLLFFVSGCAVLTYENPIEIRKTPPNYSKPPLSSDLKLELWAASTSLSRGDTLSVQLTVTNQHNSPYSKGFSSGCVYGFGLWSASGVLVAPPPPVCTMNAPIVKFEPWEVRSIEFRWVWSDSLIEPGSYQLYAGFGPRGIYESGQPIDVFLLK